MLPLTHAIQSFVTTFHREPEFVARAPGRVNLLGEHVDYNDGWVLPVAIDRAAYLAVGADEGDTATLAAPDIERQTRFRLTELDDKVDVDGQPLARWAWYPAGVAWALRQEGLAVSGIQAALSSSVPRGSGLSSSAAVEVAYACAWQRLGGWQLPAMDLALLCQRAENKYVGVNSGIMDQFASACGRAGHAMLLDCRTLESQPVPLPFGVSIVVADTTIRRELGRSEYNIRRAQCEQAVQTLRQVLPGIRALRDVSLDDFNRYSHLLDPVVESRARHVVEEMARTLQAVELLKQGRLDDFGNLMNACHASLRDLYEVSSPELDAMARAAQRIEGCYGARLTGAGFGGCTVNLVATPATGNFQRQLAAAYHAATGLTAEIYVCQAAAGAGVLPTT